MIKKRKYQQGLSKKDMGYPTLTFLGVSSQDEVLLTIEADCARCAMGVLEEHGPGLTLRVRDTIIPAGVLDVPPFEPGRCFAELNFEDFMRQLQNEIP